MIWLQTLELFVLCALERALALCQTCSFRVLAERKEPNARYLSLCLGHRALEPAEVIFLSTRRLSARLAGLFTGS